MRMWVRITQELIRDVHGCPSVSIRVAIMRMLLDPKQLVGRCNIFDATLALSCVTLLSSTTRMHLLNDDINSVKN